MYTQLSNIDKISKKKKKFRIILIKNALNILFQ